MSVFNSVWKSLSFEFDLSDCVYKIINGRVFIHFPKTKYSNYVRVKITRNAQENKNILYDALESIIVAWLGNTKSFNENVYSRIGPNKICYYVINFTILDYVIENNEIIVDEDNNPIIDCRSLYKNFEWDDDWDCIWEDENNPESYEIDGNGLKTYKWTKNWIETFKDDFD